MLSEKQDAPAVQPNCTSIRELAEKLTGRPEVALAAIVNGAVPNTLFGKRVECDGLACGRDSLRQRGRSAG